jgi:predicted DsbA family dithiol-disulfide isomerase
MKSRIRIDIVSDVVCPWCYIGKRRLEKALAELNEEFEFDIEYLPFELNPRMPAGGISQEEYLTEKFGSVERFKEVTRQVSEIAHQEGLEFNFEKQKVSPNTRKAHALIQLAHSEGKQEKMVEILFEAYFSNGKDLSQELNLIDLGLDAGLSREKMEMLFNDDNALLQVSLKEQELYNLGITGVPFYIINNKYGISGAQPSSILVNAIQDIGKEFHATKSSVG